MRASSGPAWSAVWRQPLKGAVLAWALALSGTALAQETATLQRDDGQALAVTAYPARDGACRGIALVSPGAGGSEQGYAYLGQALSSLGYLAVVMGHPESGRRALREQIQGQGGVRAGLAGLVTGPEAYRGRILDIAATRKWAQARCSADDAILVGHSMGAATTMIEAGARNKVGVAGARSFGAYIALSPQGSGLIFPEQAWGDIRQPVLLLTGTRDSELAGGSWETRTEPFRAMPPGCKWLGVIEGATHMNFSGQGAARRVEALVAQTIGAFLEARRRGDCAAPAAVRGIEVSAR